MPYCSATAEIMYAARPFLRTMLESPRLSGLRLFEDRLARILGVEFGELAQQLAAALVLELGHADHHFHVLVSANAVVLGRNHAAFAHAELLPRLRARGNVEQRLALDGGHADLGPQGGLGDADRH